MTANYRRTLAKTAYQRHGYTSYLNSSYWKKLKQKIFPVKCLLCGKDGEVLHHIEYKNIAFEKYNEIIPLCFFCHKNIHATLDIAFPNYDMRKKVRLTKQIWPSISRGEKLSTAIKQSGWKEHYEGCYNNIPKLSRPKKKRKLKNIVRSQKKRQRKIIEMKADRDFHEKMCNN